jgi:hypothetical protein
MYECYGSSTQVLQPAEVSFGLREFFFLLNHVFSYGIELIWVKLLHSFLKILCFKRALKEINPQKRVFRFIRDLDGLNVFFYCSTVLQEGWQNFAWRMTKFASGNEIYLHTLFIKLIWSHLGRPQLRVLYIELISFQPTHSPAYALPIHTIGSDKHRPSTHQPLETWSRTPTDWSWSLSGGAGRDSARE